MISIILEIIMVKVNEFIIRINLPDDDRVNSFALLVC